VHGAHHIFGTTSLKPPLIPAQRGLTFPVIKYQINLKNAMPFGRFLFNLSANEITERRPTGEAPVLLKQR
jgi:hypothetical protein